MAGPSAVDLPQRRLDRRSWSRREIVTATLLAVGGLLTALCLLLLVALWRVDAAIQARTGKATAQVLSESWDRTVVRFTTPDGNVHTPVAGVVYPERLDAGELVRVEYDTAHPETVRVAERSVTLAFLPVGMTIAGIWIVVPPVVWRVRRGPLRTSTSRAADTAPKDGSDAMDAGIDANRDTAAAPDGPTDPEGEPTPDAGKARRRPASG